MEKTHESNSDTVSLPQFDGVDIIKLNVGGKIFQTTATTVRSGGPDSLLSALFAGTVPSEPIFIDRDPEIFSVILSLLRTNRLPSTAARQFSRQDLFDEALYYGLESLLRSAFSPRPLSGIDASLISTITPSSDGFVSAFTAAAPDGSISVSHAGQISTYDAASLLHTSTIRTHLDLISCIRRVADPGIVAAGSHSAAGIHFYSSSSGRHAGSAHWTDPSDPRIFKSRVIAIADSADSVYASFDCRHGENAILVVDKSTLEIVSEIGRQSGRSAKSSAPGKLTWVPGLNVLVGSSVTSGAFGYAGYVRIWDHRSGEMVWETSEPGSGRSSRFGDPMCDVDVDSEEMIVAKVCSRSGDVGLADMRKLGEDPWVYLEDPNPGLKVVGSGGAGYGIVHCYGKQVFVAREEGLEVWSRRDGVAEYRRNYVDRVEDVGRGAIRIIEGGGTGAGGGRLFVARENVEGVEVWESSSFSGMVPVS